MSGFVLGVDSNVLVRFLAEDDADQTPKARQLLLASEQETIFVGLVVLVETYWVLTQIKKYPGPAVRKLFAELLQSGGIRFEHPDLVRKAIEDAEHAGCDFADAVIAWIGAEAGCRTTATFDRRAQRLANMTSVESLLK